MSTSNPEIQINPIITEKLDPLIKQYEETVALKTISVETDEDAIELLATFLGIGLLELKNEHKIQNIRLITSAVGTPPTVDEVSFTLPNNYMARENKIRINNKTEGRLHEADQQFKAIAARILLFKGMGYSILGYIGE
jgi:hypothetical protein